MSYHPSSAATKGRNAAILGFGIFLVYAALRFLIYAYLPAATFFDWFVRDTIMNGPRLLALSLALFLGLRVWGREALGLHAHGGRTATFVFLTFFLLLWLPDAWSGSRENGLGIPALLVLMASSILVGCWEEILYRGVLLNAIRDWKGTRAAIWGSSILFTIMHVQAQPVSQWPSIFLSGVLFAVMRMQGVGLIWLISVHAAYDALALLGSAGRESIQGLSVLLFLLRGAFVVAYYRQSQKEEDECEVPHAPPNEEPAPVLRSEPAESEPHQRLRRALSLVESSFKKEGNYRIRLHITKVNDAGEEKDLGPWPEVMAQVSRFDDAADLCSLFSHHLRVVLFPSGRLE